MRPDDDAALGGVERSGTELTSEESRASTFAVSRSRGRELLTGAVRTALAWGATAADVDAVALGAVDAEVLALPLGAAIAELGAGGARDVTGAGFAMGATAGVSEIGPHASCRTC